MAVTTTVPVLTDRQATTAVGPGTYARIHPHTRTLKHKHAHVVVVVNVRSFIPRLRFFFFEVEIRLRTLIPPFMLGSVHSGSAS